MIKLLQTEGRTAPIFKCDVCDERILDADNAAVLFETGYVEGSERSCIHVHKGACDAEAQRRAGGHLSWQPLDHHLLYLAGNVGLSHEKLQAVDAVLAEMNF